MKLNGESFDTVEDMKLNGESFDIVEDNINKLKELFPEIVNGDNEVDLEALIDLFDKNEDYVVDDSEEHYKFTWWGKKEAKKIAREKTTKTLRPIKKDSKNWDSTENIYIEGDNLEAMKILLGSYRNRIKMIYIDPPYNTGNDFVYMDKFSENEKEYLEKTNQLTEEGFLKENKITDGKYHSNWLNMIYPRLIIAKKLLREDGVIFISIDDNEVANLKKICDEIFGEQNRLDRGVLIWPNKGSTKGFNKIVKNHEYLLAYSNNEKLIQSFYGINNPSKMDIIDERLQIKRSKKNPISQVKFPKGLKIEGVNNIIFEKSIGKGTNKIDIINGTLEFKNGQLVKDTILEASYPYKNQMIDFFNKIDTDEKTYDYKGQEWKEIYFTKTGVPHFRKLRKFKIISSILENISNSGFHDLEKLNIEDCFDNSKPINLIYTLITYFTEPNDLILDFFSGSGTTAHAVLNSNSIEKASRKFIQIQLPETCDSETNAYKNGFKNISEIGKERIRRAGEKILKESDDKDLDVGFKVFKVDESNFIPWNSKLNKENVKHSIISTENNLVEGRSELDLIYELILKLNLDLNSPIEEIVLENENKNKIYVINNGFMFVCLDSDIDKEIANDLLELKEDFKSDYSQVILRDGALTDEISFGINDILNSYGVDFYTL